MLCPYALATSFYFSLSEVDPYIYRYTDIYIERYCYLTYLHMLPHALSKAFRMEREIYYLGMYNLNHFFVFNYFFFKFIS